MQRNIFHMEIPDTYEEKNPTMYENTAFRFMSLLKGICGGFTNFIWSKRD